MRVTFNASAECDGSIEECRIGVKSIKPVSSNSEVATIEVCTLEEQKWTIDVDERGWKKRGDEEQFYETLHSLLVHESPKYKQCFGNALNDKLQELFNLQQNENGAL